MRTRFRVIEQVLGDHAYVSSAAMPPAEADRLCRLANGAEGMRAVLKDLIDEELSLSAVRRRAGIALAACEKEPT